MSSGYEGNEDKDWASPFITHVGVHDNVNNNKIIASAVTVIIPFLIDHYISSPL
jgi:hypothetical protein